MKIYIEIMSHSPANFITCVIVAFVTYSQGLQFSMDIIPDIVSCGQLYCWIGEDITDTNIFSIVGLTIYYVTPVNNSVKLASLSSFDSQIDVQKTEITVIKSNGSISRYQAELTLSLRDNSFCRNVSFLCELDFVNAKGESSVIRKTVSPGTRSNCHEIEKENAELRNENVALKTELSRLQEFLNSTHDLDQVVNSTHDLDQVVNSTHDLDQVTCVNGTPHNSPREKFLLWGKVPALCDTETDGGGWIVIQRRTKGDVNFYRGWEDYNKGFGTPDTDFWIGNDVIHNLTANGYTELRVDLEHQGKQYFAHYSHFDVAAESSLYRLSVSDYNGTSGDSLSDLSGRNFSTFDKDNDGYSNSCASERHGAWWYAACGWSNLNGMWRAANISGLVWDLVTGLVTVSVSEMKIRQQ